MTNSNIREKIVNILMDNAPKTYLILQLLKNSLPKPIDTTFTKLPGTRSYAEGWNDCIEEVTKTLEGAR